MLDESSDDDVDEGMDKTMMTASLQRIKAKMVNLFITLLVELGDKTLKFREIYTKSSGMERTKRQSLAAIKSFVV